MASGEDVEQEDHHPAGHDAEVWLTSLRVLGDGTLADAIRANIPKGPDHVLWCAYDTPVDDDDNPDTEWVLAQLGFHLGEESQLVILSSQLPVGTCARAEARFSQHRFAVVPENVRVASVVADWRNQARTIVGIRGEGDRATLTELLQPFAERLIFMSPESAEMVKHALNAYLALTCVFGMEIAELCPQVGADMDDVYEGLESEPRVGGYLKPVGGFSGGTLGRYVQVLRNLGAGPLIDSIKPANRRFL